jgi:hypothetical protein
MADIDPENRRYIQVAETASLGGARRAHIRYSLARAEYVA